MMSDTENTEHVEQMFTELRRVVRIGGRYICITLAQDHIVRKILNYFPVHQWIVRVHKVHCLRMNYLPLCPFCQLVQLLLKKVVTCEIRLVKP